MYCPSVVSTKGNSSKQSQQALKKEPKAIHILNEGYKHCKAIASDKESTLLEETHFWKKLNNKNLKEDGVIFSEGKSLDPEAFVEAIGKHRFWDRKKSDDIPA